MRNINLGLSWVFHRSILGVLFLYSGNADSAGPNECQRDEVTGRHRRVEGHAYNTVEVRHLLLGVRSDARMGVRLDVRFLLGRSLSCLRSY